MNENFTCIIVDDEPDAIELLRDRLTQLYKGVDILGKYQTWVDALEALRTKKIDLVFMDISMPGKNGMNLLSLVPKLESEIIFVTAHEKYALNAFKFLPSGFLLKPVDDLELAATVNKVLERIQFKKLAYRSKFDTSQMPDKKIGIPSQNSIDYLNVADILYFEAVKGYTNVVTNTREILSSFSIGKFSQVLDHGFFYQVHRSYIININYVLRYNLTGEVVMSDNKHIPVSKKSKDEFLRLFNTITGRPA